MTSSGLKKNLSKISEYFSPSFYVTKNKSPKEGIDTRIVTFIDENSYISEQFKILRTNFLTLSMASEKPFKTILITSSIPQEGKGITISNLAFAMSLDKEKKVLLIDADLRKPSIHKLFGIPKSPGFSNIIEGSAGIDYFSKKPVLGNLYVIPIGDTIHNPSELLTNKKVKEFLEKVKLSFDYIFLDSPPVVNVTDAIIVGPLCDAVILVVKAEVTPKRLVEEAYNLLTGAGAKPKACILTNTLASHYYRYYKYYKNKYYQQEENKKVI